MQVDKEPLSQQYTVTITEDDTKYIKEEKEKCWQRFKKEQSVLVAKTIHGFRPDNVPRSLGEKKFELGQIYEVFLNSILSKGLTQSKLSIVAISSNKVEIGMNDGPIIVTVEVDVSPTVALGQYKGLNIKYDSAKVTDQEVEAVLQRLRENNAVEEKVTDRPVQNGDVVLLEFVGKIDSKEFEGGSTKKADGTHKPWTLTVGSGQFIKGFEEQLLGVKTDQPVVIKTTFPENYYKQEFRSKEAVFDTVVKEIHIKHLPDLNDEFIKKNGYTNLVDARNKLKEDLLANKKNQSEMIIEDRLMSELVKNCKLSPIPKKLLQEQLDLELQRLLRRINLDEKAYFAKTRSNRDVFDRHYKTSIERDIKIRYILETIAVEENIKVSDDELQATLKKEAEKRKVNVVQLDAEVIRKNSIVQKTLEFIKKEASIEETPSGATVTEINLEEKDG